MATASDIPSLDGLLDSILDQLSTDVVASLAAMQPQGDCITMETLGGLGFGVPGRFDSVSVPFPDFLAVVRIISRLQAGVCGRPGHSDFRKYQETKCLTMQSPCPRAGDTTAAGTMRE